MVYLILVYHNIHLASYFPGNYMSKRMHMPNLYFQPLAGATFDELSNIMEALAEREKCCSPSYPGCPD